MTKPLAGQVAIVTGASRGIGKGLAIGLAEAGAAVVCAARTVVEEPGGLPGSITATADAITTVGGKALAMRCDIGSEDDIAAVVNSTLKELGRIDVLVNDAMAPTRALFKDTTPALWDESMSTNVRSLFLLCHAVLTPMAADGGGSIINISSGAAAHGSNPHLPPGFAVYAIAKAAMERFSTILAGELAGDNIAINALRPGAVKTERAFHELGEDFDWTGWTTPDAVVPAVVHLAGQRADGLTGRILDSREFGTTWP